MPEIDFNDLVKNELDFNDLSKPQEPSNFGEVFTENAGRSFIDNILNAPNAIGELAGGALAGATAGVKTFGESLGAAAADVRSQRAGIPAAPFSFGEAFGRNNEDARNTFPASTLIAGMSPFTSFDIEAGIKSIPEAARQTIGSVNLEDSIGAFQEQQALNAARQESNIPSIGDTFDENRDQSLEGAITRAEGNPFAASSGEVLGDAATLVSGRAPIVSAARKSRLAPQGVQQVTERLEPGVRNFLDRKISGDLGTSLREGGFKIREAGFEGALMAAINDEDPLTAAALSAGSQTAGSFILSGFDKIPGNTKATKLAVLAAVGTSVFQLFKAATPGGRDRILESEESSYDKLVGAIALGGLFSVAGFSRPGRETLDDLGVFADAANSFRRGAAISILSDFGDDSENQGELVLQKLSQDPDFFGPTAARRIERVLTGESEASFSEVIDGLMVDRAFRNKLNSLKGSN